jgi:hypothetical protein
VNLEVGCRVADGSCHSIEEKKLNAESEDVWVVKKVEVYRRRAFKGSAARIGTMLGRL